jgi:hypothetical protein
MFAVVVVAPVVVVQPGSEAAGTEYYHTVTDTEKIPPQTSFKGTVSQDFCFMFFSRIVFPQAPENNN